MPTPKVGERRYLVSVYLEPPTDENGDADRDRQEQIGVVVPTLEDARRRGKKLASRSDAEHGLACIYEVAWTNGMGDDGGYDPNFKCQWMEVSDVIEEIFAEE